MTMVRMTFSFKLGARDIKVQIRKGSGQASGMSRVSGYSVGDIHLLWCGGFQDLLRVNTLWSNRVEQLEQPSSGPELPI